MQADIKAVESLASRIDINRFAGSKILITGASGMLGSYLTNTLNEMLKLNGKEPAYLTLTSKYGNFKNINLSNIKNFKLYTGDYSDLLLEDGFQYIFHASSPASPAQYSDVKSIYDANLRPLEAIAKSQSELQEIYFISTGETYGKNLAAEGLSESEIFNGMAESRIHYPMAKLEAESLVKKISHQTKCRYRIIKLFHCFGPGVRENDGRSFADFLWAVANGRTPQLISDGTDVRTFLYLEDVIAGILVNTGSDSYEYNVGSSKSIRIIDFAKKIMEMGGIPGDPIRSNKISPYEISPHRQIIPNCDWLKERGWFEKVSLEEAIERTLNHIKST